MAQQDLVQRWLRGRQEIIVELVGLTREVRSVTATDAALQMRLQGFCAALVDYVSAGHFEIYSCLVDRGEAAALFSRVRAQLQRTTDKVLAFNDAVSRKRPDLVRLGSMLTSVGIAVEDRLAIEDRLIRAARVAATSHSAVPATAFATLA